MRSRVALVFSLFICTFVVVACHSASSPTDGPEARCAASCESDVPNCPTHSCVRGCRFVLDRLVEHEGKAVIACVAKANKANADACKSDKTWASCAVNVGPYADGGPPPPTFKHWEDEEDEGS